MLDIRRIDWELYVGMLDIRRIDWELYIRDASEDGRSLT